MTICFLSKKHIFFLKKKTGPPSTVVIRCGCYAAFVLRFDLRYKTNQFRARQEKKVLTSFMMPSISSFEGCSDSGAVMIALMMSAKGMSKVQRR